jgi:PAS domain S-box-containing protein
MQHGGDSIRQMLNVMGPRVHTIRTSAAATPPSPLLDDALTELRTAMEELQVSEEELRVQAEEVADRQVFLEAELGRWRDLFRLSPDPRLVTDTDGVVAEANEAAHRLLRVANGALHGKPLAVFVPDEERRTFRSMLRRLAQHEAVEAEMRLRPRDSLPVDVEIAATARSAVPGGPVEVHWTLRDVTARRSAAATRDEAADLHRWVLESLPVAAVAMDLDGSVLLWTRGAQRLLGWSEDEVLGRRNPALADDELARTLEAGQRGGAEPRTALAHRRDGTSAAVVLHEAPLTDAAGAVRGLLSVLGEPGGADQEAAAAAQPVGDDTGEGGRRRWTREESLRVLRGTVSAGRSGDVAGRLRAWIAAGLHLGYLRPGDRLPSIRDVSQECEVDHRAVSASYRTLAAEGVVEVRSRHGVYLGELSKCGETGLSETAEWLAAVLGDACGLQLRVPLLPELVRDWTSSTRVACACVDDTEDGLVALSGELRQQWGLETYTVPVSDVRTARFDEAALTAELRRADVVVTTPYHAGQVGAVAAALGKPLVVLRANPEMVQAVEERLAAAPLTAIVADVAYGERLRCIRGGSDPERLRVVPVSDGAALDALDRAQPVLLTRAAQQRLPGNGLRLLFPLSPSFCPSSARDLAAVLIRCNVRAARAAG